MQASPTRNSSPPRFPASSARNLDHRRADIHSRRKPVRPGNLRQRKSRSADSTSDVEHFVTRNQVQALRRFRPKILDVGVVIQEPQKLNKIRTCAVRLRKVANFRHFDCALRMLPRTISREFTTSKDAPQLHSIPPFIPSRDTIPRRPLLRAPAYTNATLRSRRVRRRTTFRTSRNARSRDNRTARR